MNIKSNDLLRQFQMYKEEYEKKAIEVLNSGWYILGNELKEFEREFSQYINSKYCIGVGNGLDALVLAFRALEIKNGDEVIVQGNTYIASIMGITINGATPVFVEPNEFYNINVDKIEEKITEKTKAILVVHLYGQATNMKKILELCKKYKLYLVEDCAQSHGAKYKDKTTGTFGDIGCFSFYPSKNMGAFGDAGAVVTDNEELAEKIRVLRNYGSEKRYYNMIVGYNSRLDEIQAGLLRIKLSHIQELQNERNVIANKYLTQINNKKVILPKIDLDCSHVWHLFVLYVDEREKFIKYLEENGIQTIIHYPIPPHLSKAYEYLKFKSGDLPITEDYANKVVTIPLFNGLEEKEINYVIDVVNKF